MSTRTISLLSAVTLAAGAFATDEFFLFQTVFGQSSGGHTYSPFPVGFREDGSDTYTSTLEVYSTEHRARRLLIGGSIGSLKTAESTPQLYPAHANHMNQNGLVVGYSTDGTNTIPVRWSYTSLTSDTPNKDKRAGSFTSTRPSTLLFFRNRGVTGTKHPGHPATPAVRVGAG